MSRAGAEPAAGAHPPTVGEGAVGEAGRPQVPWATGGVRRAAARPEPLQEALRS